MNGPPMNPRPEPDTEHAIGFLQLLDDERRCDLAAIDPRSPGIEAVTFLAPVKWDLVRRQIDAWQGRKNVYVSVNCASAEAPTGVRLNRNTIGQIRAVVLDVDTKKIAEGDPSGENFKRERERLKKEVAAPLANNSECPPSWLVDSGGGYQAWWQLPEPVDATPANVILAEGIGRTLQQRYGGDPVWDMPRIMRVPGTINVPSPAKAAQGRSAALAYALGVSTQRKYELAMLATWAPPTALRAKQDPKLPEIDMDVVSEASCYDELLSELRTRFEAACAKDRVLDRLWDGHPAPEQKDLTPSGSAFALAGRLVRGGFTVTEFGMLYWVWDHRSEKEIDARYIARAWGNNPLTAGSAGFDAVTIAERNGK
ncbi:MAG: hypothetical protein ACLP8B_15900, partial [Xanthobacteraceae bacterium]